MSRSGYGNRAIWSIAAPMMVSNLSIPLLGLVDTAVVGHLDGPQHLGAVAVGATVFSLLFMGLNFLRMGTTGVAAQRYGAADGTGLRSVLGQALLIAAALSLILIALQVPIGAVAMTVIAPEPQVRALALDYFHIRIWAAVPTLANFVLVGWLLGTQNARGPLMIMLTTNTANIFLDLLFVVVFQWGVAGVALASVIGESLGLLVGLTLVRRRLRRHQGAWQRDSILDWSGIRKLAQINGNLFIRTLSLMFTFTFITSWGARLGATFLAVNAVLMNFQHIMSYGLDGIAHAAEALVGKAVGERRRSAVREAVKGSLRWSALFGLAFATVFAVGGTYIVDLLTDLPEIRQTARDYLPWLILSPLISLWSFAYDGIFIGATRAREMRNAMLVSTLGVFLPACLLFRELGNHGLWLAFMLFMLSRAVTMAWLWSRIDRLGFAGEHA